MSRPRLVRLNTGTVPAFRLLGFNLLALGVLLHNAVVLQELDWPRFLWYVLFVEVYALASWAVLLRWYRPDARVDLALLFLLADLVPLALAVHVTGADRSWIFWVFLFRVGDQTLTYFWRALLFTHLGALSYLAVIVYVAAVEGRPVAWPPELAKALFLYLGGLYLALAARTAEQIRERLRRAIHTAKASVARLSEQSRELQEARAQAESASRAKSEFLSRVSHELRTPMNAILGFAQLLEMEDLPDAQRAHVAEILDGGRHLLDIMNEVMDIARVETGSLAHDLEPVAVGPALSDVLEAARSAAAARAVTLPETAAAAGDAHVMGHTRKLRQVLGNLISNAIRYNSSPGRVDVSCGLRGDRLRVTVTDTGPGIPADRVEAAFLPFVRLGEPQDSPGGTGLGLSVARSMVQAMGGQMGVDTEPGAGSAFWFELALAQPTGGTEMMESTTSPENGPLVLYIDDNPENVTLVRRILARRPGVKLVTASLGQAGLDAAEAQRPDLILLDLELPDISGHDVLARLRSGPSTRGIPVVVVSAEATPSVVERVLADGARTYFTMPYDVSEFLGAIDEILGLD